MWKALIRVTLFVWLQKSHNTCANKDNPGNTCWPPSTGDKQIRAAAEMHAPFFKQYGWLDDPALKQKNYCVLHWHAQHCTENPGEWRTDMSTRGQYARHYNQTMTMFANGLSEEMNFKAGKQGCITNA